MSFKIEVKIPILAAKNAARMGHPAARTGHPLQKLGRSYHANRCGFIMS